MTSKKFWPPDQRDIRNESLRTTRKHRLLRLVTRFYISGGMRAFYINNLLQLPGLCVDNFTLQIVYALCTFMGRYNGIVKAMEPRFRFACRSKICSEWATCFGNEFLTKTHPTPPPTSTPTPQTPNPPHTPRPTYRHRCLDTVFREVC